MRSRQRGQSVIEFGIIAIVFTLIMFAIADFGLLLNDWLSVSSGVRLLARDAAVGTFTCSANCPSSTFTQTTLAAEAGTLKIPGVTANPQHFGGGYCCSSDSALVLTVVYYDQCTPNVGSCAPISNQNLSTLDSRYSTLIGGVPAQGGCNNWTQTLLPPCEHPSPPRPTGSCSTGPNNPCPGDTVVVTLTAAGAQVITPLIRQIFQVNAAPGQCPDNSTPSRCYVSLSSSVTMRFEGDTL